MKLPSLIHLSLILMLTSEGHTDQNWNVNVTRNIQATLGSNVTIDCSFTYPHNLSSENVKVYWKTFERSNFSLDKDPDAFVFHPNKALVNEKYREKTKLFGNVTQKSCSLWIFNFTDEKLNIYMRAMGKEWMYSYRKNNVSISVSGDVIPAIHTSDTTNIAVSSTMATIQGPSSIEYTAIFVPVAALLIIICVAGIFFFLKNKRSQTLTREESGYYANVSRSNQAKRNASSKTQENENTSELKVIDEPVYNNFEAPPGQMGQGMNHTENIYGNVDYSQ
ncbi:sialic acid-binding Ig-like lectin 12 [Notothenia coriiceps]|uniref:Sialic acid-binding Ig-like lectin 12 n=1 Tax=Notothenia coriiceps TaxID=8208 RepID=A0A6I9PK40_9TELE|nr:PREDICTED: sialic acid-binding Ig-like lectin 12 [Notothenia coriiceps]